MGVSDFRCYRYAGLRLKAGQTGAEEHLQCEDTNTDGAGTSWLIPASNNNRAQLRCYPPANSAASSHGSKGGRYLTIATPPIFFSPRGAGHGFVSLSSAVQGLSGIFLAEHRWVFAIPARLRTRNSLLNHRDNKDSHTPFQPTLFSSPSLLLLRHRHALRPDHDLCYSFITNYR